MTIFLYLYYLWLISQTENREQQRHLYNTVCYNIVWDMAQLFLINLKLNRLFNLLKSCRQLTYPHFLGRLPKRSTGTGCPYFHRWMTIALLEPAAGREIISQPNFYERCDQTMVQTHDPWITNPTSSLLHFWGLAGHNWILDLTWYISYQIYAFFSCQI